MVRKKGRWEEGGRQEAREGRESRSATSMFYKLRVAFPC